MYINRTIESQIRERLFQGKAIVLYGPRRSGKTTLVKKMFDEIEDKKLFLNGDELLVQEYFSSRSAVKLKKFLGNTKFVVLDEAQNIQNIGINIKILVDTYPEIQIVATGSSSFDLASEIKESMVGRHWEFFLPPLSIQELSQNYDFLGLEELKNTILLYGLYPGIFTAPEALIRENLQSLTDNYLYKDVLNLEGTKISETLVKLLKLLAFQVGSEVSFNELANTLNVSKSLVERYVYLLEQSFVIFSLRPLSRNLRNELGKMRKLYFWDLGVRNTLIQNFNELEIRPDKGALWENFCILERRKKNLATHFYTNDYFWRTHEGQEIDYIEEYAGALHAYEFKWNSKKKAKIPPLFAKAYDQHEFKVINQENWQEFVK